MKSGTATTCEKNLNIGTNPVKASIVIVNYNAGQKLAHCLDSLCSSLQSQSYEVVVVDNDSSDGMAEIIEKEYPQAKLIKSGSNLEFGGGCNLGYRHASGEFLVFLNPDTLLQQGWLEALLAPFEMTKDAGLVTAKILVTRQPALINACGCNVHISGITLCRGAGKSSDEFPKNGPIAAVSGAVFAIRRQLFGELGGFDENMFLYLEDTDLSWRAAMAGWQTIYTAKSIVYHDYELRIPPKKIYWLECNRYSMLLKSLKWPTLLLLFPALVLAEIVSWGFVLLKDRANSQNKLRAYQWLMTHWRMVLEKRKKLQKSRVVKDRDLIKLTTSSLDFSQASSGLVAFFSKLIFNPLFYLMRAATLAMVWW